MAERIIFEDDTKRTIEETTPTLRGVRTEWKPGSDGATAEAEGAFVGQRAAALVVKARAIMADPANAADWTAQERKVILAALALDLAQRRR